MDFETNFLDSGRPGLIQNEHHSVVSGIFICPQKNADIMVLAVKFLKAWVDIVARDLLFFEVDVHERVDSDDHKIGSCVRIGANRGR